MTPGSWADRQLATLVITLLCGVLGGLLGQVLGNRLWFIDDSSRVLALLAGTVISTGVAFFLLTTKRPESVRWSPQPERAAEPPPPEHRAYSWPAVSTVPTSPTTRMTPIAQRSEPERRPAAEYVRITLPRPPGNSPGNSPGNATGQWWAETSSATTQSNRGEPSPLHRSPIPPPSSGDPESDLIAQCPHCGEFGLDVRHVAPAYAFQCRNGRCGKTWTWTPGTPWPPVVVRRNLPGGSAPDGAVTE